MLRITEKKSGDSTATPNNSVKKNVKEDILNVVSQVLDKAETKLKRFDNLIKDVETIKNFLEKEKTTLQNRIKTLRESNTSLENDKSALQKEVETLKADKTSLETEKSALQIEIETLKTDKTSLEAEKSDLQKGIETLKTDKSSLETEKSALQENVKTLETEKSSLETDKSALQKDIETLKAKTENFETGAEIYTDLLKAIYQCPSMKDYIVEKGLPDTIDEVDEQAIIRFVSLAGGRNIFAGDMLNCINKYKRDNPQSMTNEEKNLMDAVNIFYQKKDNIPDKDLLFIPDGMENSAECKVIFKKSEMRDIRTALGNFKTAVTLYSPGLRDINNNTISIKATVEGK